MDNAPANNGSAQKTQTANSLNLTDDFLSQRSKLRKSFGRKEVLFFSVCSVIGLDTIGVIAAAGPEAISWMAVLAIVFLIPASMVIAELSSAFTTQGGPYMWVRLAFGRLAGAITAVISWLKSPIWFGGILAFVAVATAETFFMLPYAAFRTSALAMLLYGVPILTVLLVLPIGQVNGLTGFVDALKSAFTVYGGSIAEDGTVTLTGAGVYLGAFAGVLIIIAVFASGVTWLMSTNRNLAAACFDGSGPRWIGFTNPRYGTPVRLNNIAGIVASAILILGYRLNDGDVAKYFGVAIGFAVAMSLVNYLAIFPAFWVLRNKYPDTTRPYRVPAHRTVSIWLTVVVAFGITQLLAPGFGDKWFGDAYRPAGWVADQGRPYYLTELAVLLAPALIAVGSWYIGKRNLASASIRHKAGATHQQASESTEDSDGQTKEEPASNN